MKPGTNVDRAMWVWAAAAMNRAYVLGFQKARLADRCPLPATGPAILICNHLSGLDPFVLQATTPRIIRWLMAKEYYDIAATKPLCEKLGFIPVARSGRDSASLKQALRTLDAGHVVGIFPEGKINDTADILPFQPGVALMATRSGATVVPARLSMQHFHSMLYPALDPQRPIVRFGEPFTASGKLDEAAERMRQAILAIRDARPPRVTNGYWW